jgi:hypothetical protein
MGGIEHTQKSCYPLQQVKDTDLGFSSERIPKEGLRKISHPVGSPPETTGMHVEE